MEPSITASLDLFAPFGSSPANGKAQLKGSFGNAMLDNIPDYYSQLLTKVLSNNMASPTGGPSLLQLDSYLSNCKFEVKGTSGYPLSTTTPCILTEQPK